MKPDTANQFSNPILKERKGWLLSFTAISIELRFNQKTPKRIKNSIPFLLEEEKT